MMTAMGHADRVRKPYSYPTPTVSLDRSAVARPAAVPGGGEAGTWAGPDFAQVRVHGDAQTNGAGQLADLPTSDPAADGVLQRCGRAPCAACSQDDDVPLMRQQARGPGGPSSLPSIVREVLPASGRPLEPAVQAFFEPRFGHDFSAVRVRSDEQAARAADAIDASAFTVGNSIWF